jgi:hypothetical protein
LFQGFKTIIGLLQPAEILHHQLQKLRSDEPCKILHCAVRMFKGLFITFSNIKSSWVLQLIKTLDWECCSQRLLDQANEELLQSRKGEDG